ncbi:hypothetical protein [Halobacterium sp. CBA1126]|uniref:hypothetical protein n=1 Tax=Halobacterium sp. CBA1126 TaxID=2668074 RepID=UPI0012F9DD5B|nr:hypothetical protein [Halobacterium sp. CBA1126]MUV60611.1 hypothetical protein [Halobacterium sp. CBA1126]
MSRTTATQKEVPPADSGAQQIGDHAVIRKRELVPGKHPDPQLRREGQTQYLEQYFECVHCGIEVLSKMDLPDDCDGDAR